MASRPSVVSCNIHGSRIDGLRGRKQRTEIVMFVQVGGWKGKTKVSKKRNERKKKKTYQIEHMTQDFEQDKQYENPPRLGLRE